MNYIQRKMSESVRWLLAAWLLAVMFLAAGGALAQSGGGYDLSWNTMDGGGGRSSAGQYTLDGTIGQPDAGMMTGGTYALTGGFWTQGGGGYRIFLPLVLRGGWLAHIHNEQYNRTR